MTVMMARLAIIVGAVLTGLVGPSLAMAGYGDPPSPPPGSGPASSDRTVNANGDPFSGGLAFDPAHVKAKVGQTVSWTNTDAAVPHTATEDHFLWALAGDYGPPGNMGFAPGETVHRRFAAGTWHYFCQIHPTQMRGVIDVPVTLRSSRGARPGRFVVTAIWSKEQLPRG